jgi:hypothetical protein
LSVLDGCTRIKATTTSGICHYEVALRTSSILDGCMCIKATPTSETRGLHTYVIPVRNIHSFPSWTDVRALKRLQPVGYIPLRVLCTHPPSLMDTGALKRPQPVEYCGLHKYMMLVRIIHLSPSWTDARALKQRQPVECVD